MSLESGGEDCNAIARLIVLSKPYHHRNNFHAETGATSDEALRKMGG